MPTSTQIILRRRSRYERAHKANKRAWFWRGIVIAMLAIVIGLPGSAAIGGAAVLYITATDSIPNPQESLFALTSEGVTRFMDRSGQRLLYSLEDPLGSRRTWVTLDSLPPYVPAALLNQEDPSFLNREGFAPLKTFEDLWRNAVFETVPPNMTITGRLVRNVLNPTPPDPAGENLARQREIALVSEINRRYTPQEILEWHLNTEYFGNEAYGIEAAAQIYLGKPASELTVGEAALLAAIPNAPQYNPFEDEAAARARGVDALRSMLNGGLISQGQYDAALAETIRIRREGYVPQLAPDFMAYARRQAEMILNDLGYDGRQMVAREGLTIETTLDFDLYLQAECALRVQIARLSGYADPSDALDGSPCVSAAFLPAAARQVLTAPPTTGSIVVLDAATGEIRALVGAAAAANAQPGVTLQPFVYLDSFVNPRRLVSPASMVLDVPLSFPGAEEGLIYSVANPDGRFYGVMNLRDAMGAWLMPPAADTAYRQGMTSVLRTAHQLGINSMFDSNYDLMLLERGGRIAPLDLAYAYSVFATLGDQRGIPVEPLARGFRGRDPVAVQRIIDRGGNVLWEYDSAAAAECRTLDVCTPLLEDALAYLLNDVYADSASRWQTLGPNNLLELGRPAAVVNGTAGDGIDNWTVGYTPQLVTVVNLRRDDAESMSLSPFATEGAASVWRAIMDYAHTSEGLPAANWERPPLILEMPVCERSGLLPNGVCPTYLELFRDGMQPRTTDTFWQRVNVNSRTGQLATVNTAPELVSAETYFVPPDEALDWWRESRQPLPPQEYDTVSVPQLFTSVRLREPQAYSYVGGEVPIYGEMDTSDMQYFQLSYGQGLNPSAWVDIGGQQTSYVAGAPLAVWNTAGLDGLYSLRLVMTQRDNQFESDALQVTVDNVAPSVSLNLIEPGRIYRFPGDSEIQIEAQAQDNLAIDRVDFYHNGSLLGADESWPYQLNWSINEPGLHTFSAVVFDAVGNSARSDLSVDVLRSGA